MLKIYGAPHSRTFRVIWLANEIGIPYEHIPVTFSVPNAQCKEPWYLALNPNGLVPAIDDSGFVMWETAAINLYLAETHKNSSIRPRHKIEAGCSSGHSSRSPRSNRRC
jgi:glutathione S-transferase